MEAKNIKDTGLMFQGDIGGNSRSMEITLKMPADNVTERPDVSCLSFSV